MELRQVMETSAESCNSGLLLSWLQSAASLQKATAGKSTTAKDPARKPTDEKKATVAKRSTVEDPAKQAENQLP